MTPDATHQRILFEAIKHTDKPILEIGAGDSSTRQLHSETTNKIVTIDDHLEWLTRYYDLKCDRHEFIFVAQNWKVFFDTDKTKWGVVLVDSSTWEQRKYAIGKYINADFIVIHDADWMFDSGIFTPEQFSKMYKYWVEYSCPEIPSPTTVLCSNTKFDIKIDAEIKRFSHV